MKELLALKFPGGEISGVAGMPEGGVGTVGKVIRWGITMLFIGITVTSLIFLIWGGIQWITSSGDKTKIEAARKRIVYAVIGLIVAFSSYLIINTIGNFFGVKLLNVPASSSASLCDDAHPQGKCTDPNKSCILWTDGHYSCHGV